MAAHATPTGNSPATPRSVRDLLALDDVAFVQAAYRVLLGREADDNGLAAFVGQVRHGDDKAVILTRLALSDEGRQRRVVLEGLEALLRAHPPRERSWAVRAIQRVSRAFVRPANEPMERLLRVLDNRLYRIELALEQQGGELTKLRDAVAQTAISVDSLKGLRPGSISEGVKAAPATPIALARQSPPRLEQVLQGFRRAISGRRANS